MKTSKVFTMILPLIFILSCGSKKRVKLDDTSNTASAQVALSADDLRRTGLNLNNLSYTFSFAGVDKSDSLPAPDLDSPALEISFDNLPADKTGTVQFSITDGSETWSGKQEEVTLSAGELKSLSITLTREGGGTGTIDLDISFDFDDEEVEPETFSWDGQNNKGSSKWRIR